MKTNLPVIILKGIVLLLFLLTTISLCSYTFEFPFIDVDVITTFPSFNKVKQALNLVKSLCTKACVKLLD